jgi:long-chain acyl-CoA synthetase
MNIATLLRRVAADHAGQVALRLDDREVRYGRLVDTAARFAAHLRADGLVAGQRVGSSCPTPSSTCRAARRLAGGRRGRAAQLPVPEAALRHAIVDSGATHVVTGPGDAAPAGGAARRRKVTLLTTGPEGSFAARWPAASRRTTWCPARDADDALIMYTSGSTGVPKGVRQTHRNTMAQVEAVIEVYELTAADHALLPMPLFHVGGLQLGTLPILLRGGQVTFMAKWDAVAWIGLAERLRPSYGGMISTMLIDVGNRTVDSPVLLDSFRVLCSAARAPERADRAAAPPAPASRRSRSTARPSRAGSPSTYPLGAPRGRAPPGAPGADRADAARPTEGGPDIAPGEDGVGELWVRGDAVTPGILEPSGRHERSGTTAGSAPATSCPATPTATSTTSTGSTT